MPRQILLPGARLRTHPLPRWLLLPNHVIIRPDSVRGGIFLPRAVNQRVNAVRVGLLLSSRRGADCLSSRLLLRPTRSDSDAVRRRNLLPCHVNQWVDALRGRQLLRTRRGS